MFGRRFTRTGWLQLGALAAAVLAVLFLVFAPVGTASIGVDLPPASATPEQAPTGDLVQFVAMQAFGFVFVGLALGLVAVVILLVIWTARKIIQAQPKADA